jgi:hypothetical protein
VTYLRRCSLLNRVAQPAKERHMDLDGLRDQRLHLFEGATHGHAAREIGNRPRLSWP